MKKLINILKTNGDWSYRRVTSFYILNIAILYALLPLLFLKFEVREFVFVALIGYSATMIGLNVWEKTTEKKETEE